MNPYLKLVIGVLMLATGVAWYVPPEVGGPFNVFWGYTMLTNLESLLVAVQSGLGFILILVGLFMAWIQLDEIRLKQSAPSPAETSQPAVKRISTTDTGRDDETDYDALVEEHTISEIQERVTEEDLDLDKVAVAEKRNKNRVTLLDWITEQQE